MIEEIWKDIEEYEGIYQVSNLGNVRNNKSKIIKSRVTKSGYVIIDLNKEGKKKTKYIHRLVAEAFIPNPDNKPCVDHLDTNKQNNEVDNLRWVNHSENMLNPLTRKHNSESSKGKIASEETRKKQSEAKKGDKHWNYGNTWDEDTKEQNMLSQPNRRPIICVETGIIYPSVNQAGRELGVKGSRIRDAITHRNGCQTYKGYHWAYYKEEGDIGE